MLSQKVEEANFRLTEDMNREWLRYTKDSETVRRLVAAVIYIGGCS